MNKKFWLRLTITVALLGLMFTWVDLSAIQLGSPVRVASGVAVAVVLLVVNQGVTALRWSVILGDDMLSLGYLTRLNMVGIFFSTFLPTSVGGDAVRAWAVAREVRESGLGVSSVVVDRFMGLVALVLYLIAGVFLASEMVTGLTEQISLALPSWLVWALGIICIPLAIILARKTRFSLWLRQSVDHIDEFRRSATRMLWTLILSMVVQGIYIAVYIVLARAVGFDLPVLTFLVTVPVVSLGALLPITLSGVGVREGLWILLLARFNMDAATVAAFSLLYFVAFAATGGIGGVIYLWRGTGSEPATTHAS